MEVNDDIEEDEDFDDMPVTIEEGGEDAKKPINKSKTEKSDINLEKVNTNAIPEGEKDSSVPDPVFIDGNINSTFSSKPTFMGTELQVKLDDVVEAQKIVEKVEDEEYEDDEFD